ncbi:MAG: hypothetical protein F6K09_35450 [Merismopedia sp. SIO2A8]|nr:hypothetical protein [Merismopedia sp. SIO2A8]
MIIREYSIHSHSFATANTQDKMTMKIAKTLLDVCLVATYIVGLLSVMPLVVTYSWAKDTLSAQLSA